MAQLSISSNLQIMGVVNATPDSFSDGGKFNTIQKALKHAQRLISEGADILDIGGESTRPGSRQVGLDEELERTIPLIEAIREMSDIPISIDTSKPGVMQASVTAGATMINSIWALQLEDSLQVAADLKVPVILMHMQGSPATMQQDPTYADVVGEVKEFLKARIDAALDAGIALEHIIIDPGFGFGKTIEHNLLLLKSLFEFKQLGVPVLAGLSRKRMIGTILDKPVDQRLYGSLSTAVMAAMLGADILRVHDVAETVDAIKMVKALGQVAT
ncbi:MAG: dihydropteroate synthase [Gammaproteobacteria bacterium]|nr:dihydropteroate synthase [Gammaproteobacteria bacterium]MDH3858929.1 dihydropteroate synthase [Gammaproteobacteria bacterium]